MTTCKICHRELNITTDPLSLDCGGDCFGCIIDAEREILYHWVPKLRDRIIELEKQLVEFKIDESILKAVAGKLNIRESND